MTAGIAGIHYLEPGIDGIVSTNENQVFYGDNRFWNHGKVLQALIAGSSRDLGNVGQTTVLRAGLLMAYDATLNRWEHYLHAATDLQGDVAGILYASIQTQKDGADQDRWVAAISVGHFWRAEGIILSDAANTGIGLTGATGEDVARINMLLRCPWVRLSDAHEQDASG